MPTYLALLTYTGAGMEAIEDSPARIDEARSLLESMGGSLDAWYLTMGSTDAVAVIDLPDDETMARFLLATGRAGNVATETLRAFTEAEFRDLVEDLPAA